MGCFSSTYVRALSKAWCVWYAGQVSLDVVELLDALEAVGCDGTVVGSLADAFATQEVVTYPELAATGLVSGWTLIQLRRRMLSNRTRAVPELAVESGAPARVAVSDGSAVGQLYDEWPVGGQVQASAAIDGKDGVL